MSQKGVLLVLGTALISGFSIFLNKFGVSGFDASVFTFLKNLAVGLLLLGIILAWKDFKILKGFGRKEWGKLVLIGLLGGSIPFLLFFNGLALTSSATASFIHKTMFIWVAILAALFLKENISKKTYFAGGLLIAGNLLLLRVTGLELGLGALLVFLATFFWASEMILSKSLLNLEDVPGRLVAAGRMFFGSVFLLLFVAFTGKVGEVGTYSGGHWLWILITSIFLLGYVFTFYTGLKSISPVTASMILLLGSPITTLLNVAFVDASITSQQLFGILLIVAGVLTSILGAGYFAWLIKNLPEKLRA